MSLDVEVSSLPKAWRGVVMVGTFLVIGAVGALAASAMSADRARAQAEITTREVMSKDIEAFKVEARQAAELAAREGAEKAVREVVGPLSATVSDVNVRQTRHEAMDDQRVQDLQRRVYNLEHLRR